MKKLICSISFLGTLLLANAAEVTNNVISTFEINTLRVTEDAMLCWTSTNENGALPYYVEQYIYNRWVEVAHIDGVGKPEATSYSVKLCFNSGENKFRLKQKGADKKTRVSKVISYFSSKKAVSYTVNKQKNSIIFSDNTYYLVYNPYGKIIKEGIGNCINTDNLNEGDYCIVFDNKVSEYSSTKAVSKIKKRKFRGIRNPYSRYKIS